MSLVPLYPFMWEGMMDENNGRFIPYLAVGASAGSGKTFALTVRYCSLLFMGVSPHKIVALTFTNKAAAQMQQRIMQTLQGIGENGYANERKEILRQTGLSEKELEGLRQEVYERFVSGAIRIMTIDKFLHGVLRHFSLYAGVMPDFSVGNQSQHRVMVEFTKRVVAKGLLDVLVYFYTHEAKKGASVIDLLKSLYAKGVQPTATSQEMGHFLSAKGEIEKRVMEASCALSELVLSCEKASDTAKKGIVAHTVQELSAKPWIERESLNYSTYAKCWVPAMDELLVTIQEGLRVWFTIREELFLGQLHAVYHEYVTTLKEMAKESNTLSFSDVATRVFELLSSQGVVSHDFLYFRLDGSLDHMLIDEFQDTSLMQYEIFAPLIEEIVCAHEGFRSFFCVGDPKQSIYRFRGAVSTLFSYVKNRYALAWQTLETNYRSCEVIVSFVNRTFHPFYPDFVPSLSVKEGGSVRVVTGEPLEIIIEHLFLLRSYGIRDEDMAILCYTNDDVLRIEKRLKEADETIKTVTETSSKLINHPKIRPLIAWLEYALEPTPLRQALFLSLVGREFDEEIDTLALQSFDPLSVPMSLKGVIDHYHLFDGDENIIRFIEMGYKAKSVALFIESLEIFDDPVVSGSVSGLRILTIHKSKGLEFEHVMVCDRLSRPISKTDTLFFVPQDEIHEEMRAYFSKRKSVDKEFSEVCDLSDALSLQDQLNGLYVALTRAKISLCIARREKQSAFEMLQMPEGVYGEIQHVTHPKNVEKHEEKVFCYRPLAMGKQEDILERPKEEEERDYRAIAWGEALHYALELLTIEGELSVVMQSVYTRFGWVISSERWGELEEILLAYQQDGFMKTLYEGEVHKEQPLVNEGRVYVIDFYALFPDKIVVLDYKSGGRKKEYHTQVGEYMHLLAMRYQKEVKGYICYCYRTGLVFEEVGV